MFFCFLLPLYPHPSFSPVFPPVYLFTSFYSFFVTLPAKYPQSTPPCRMMYPSNSDIHPFSARMKQIQFLDGEQSDCDWGTWKGEVGRGGVMLIT